MSIVGHVGWTRTALAATVVALLASDASARSHGSWGSSGSSASYGSYASYGSSSSGSYSSGSYSSGSYGSASSGSYSSGSYGRPGLFARWHAKKAAKASSGSSSSGSYAYHSYGSSSSGSYGGHGSHGSSGGSYGGGYSAPVEYYSTPVEGAPVEATPSIPAEAGASIRVNVPADAVVYVNDSLTKSTGTERSYVSRGLKSGLSYSYDLRVEFSKDGKPVVEQKHVTLAAGQTVNLSFGGEAIAAGEPVKTELKLHVPAEAKVTLAGAATKQTGELRTYSTSTLAAGQEWDGYVVRVELNLDGKSVVEEKTLSIVGGESYELTFDMAGDSAAIASIN